MLHLCTFYVLCLQKTPVIEYAQVDMSKKRVSQQEHKQTADIECNDAVTESKGTTVSIQNMLNITSTVIIHTAGTNCAI